MDQSAYLHHLAAESTIFEAVLLDGDLTATVPGCPGWDLAGLGGHLSDIHRWATRAVLVGRTEDGLTAPPGRAALIEWFHEGAAELQSVLRAVGPDTPCWTFGPPPRTAGFWLRRQALETALHRWDAQSSQGAPSPGAPAPIPVELALDGISEVADMFYPRQVRLGRIEPLAAGFEVRPDEGPSTVVGADPVVSLSGPAEALLLLIWRRIGLDDPRISVDGSRDLAQRLLQVELTP